MSTLLLVHGGWSAGWVWDRLLPELQELNAPARTIDLPGHGANHRNMWSVSLGDYANAVIDAVNEIDGPVVTVGHSMGGFVVSAAAGLSPETFDKLVYLAAFVPVNQERLIQLARKDEDSLLGPGVRPRVLSGRISLDESVCHDALFHDCAEEDERNATRQLGDNPLRPGITKIRLADGFGSIPKSYILCTEDRALTPQHQQWMANRSGVPIEHNIVSGHMPMFSAPSELARVLAGYVKSNVG